MTDFSLSFLGWKSGKIYFDILIVVEEFGIGQIYETDLIFGYMNVARNFHRNRKVWTESEKNWRNPGTQVSASLSLMTPFPRYKYHQLRSDFMLSQLASDTAAGYISFRLMNGNIECKEGWKSSIPIDRSIVVLFVLDDFSVSHRIMFKNVATSVQRNALQTEKSFIYISTNFCVGNGIGSSCKRSSQDRSVLS